MKIVLLDNYDSFTYNLLHLLQIANNNAKIVVFRNTDKSVFDESFDVLVAGPGPCTPAETGVLKELYSTIIVPNQVPYLGVCLGMQFLAWYYGISVNRSKQPVHGDTCKVTHSQTDLFENIPQNISVARYNSLEVNPDDLKTSPLSVLAVGNDTNAVMALKHNSLPICGIQFHPESFLTHHGLQIVRIFFNLYAPKPRITAT